MTLDQLHQLEQATRTRCQATAEQARRAGGVWDWVLRRWVAWDGDGPIKESEVSDV